MKKSGLSIILVKQSPPEHFGQPKLSTPVKNDVFNAGKQKLIGYNKYFPSKGSVKIKKRIGQWGMSNRFQKNLEISTLFPTKTGRKYIFGCTYYSTALK